MLMNIVITLRCYFNRLRENPPRLEGDELEGYLFTNAPNFEYFNYTRFICLLSVILMQHEYKLIGIEKQLVVNLRPSHLLQLFMAGYTEDFVWDTTDKLGALDHLFN